MEIPQRVTIMGLGLFGGGLGAAEFFARKGAAVTVTDMKSADQLAPSLEKLKDYPLTLHLGGHVESDFTDTDLVVASPGVPRESAFIRLARERGVKLETEISLFFRLCPCPIAGITGSIGKTTTTSMAGQMLACDAGNRAFGTVHVGGNIGRSLLNEAERISPKDLVVLELSSFQLEWLGEAGLSPHIAAVTNVYPNHLDRHGTMENYVAAKRSIVAYQRRGDVAVLNADDPEVRSWREHTKAECMLFGTTDEVENGSFVRDGRIIVRRKGRAQEVADVSAIRIPGRHNVQNALAAATVCIAVGARPAAIARGLAEFRGLEHRLELVRERGGVQFYNDSKATTPESAIAALDAFDGRPVIIIAGGYDKHVPLDAFARRIFEKARLALLLGATADALAEQLEQYSRDGFRWLRVNSLDDAIGKAAAKARPGDVVLLSPACASYDMFSNYEERGRKFKELCMRL